LLTRLPLPLMLRLALVRVQGAGFRCKLL